MNPPSADRHRAEAFEQDHTDLKALLNAVRAALAPSTRDHNAVQDLIEKLATEVVEHFQLEERGGYFAEAVRRAPQMAETAIELQSQHDPLLESLEGLRALVRSGVESDAWWARVGKELDRFANELLQHEAGERAMLQRAYGQDIGSGD